MGILEMLKDDVRARGGVVVDRGRPVRDELDGSVTYPDLDQSDVDRDADRMADELSDRMNRQSRRGADILAANRAAVAASGVKVEPKPERVYGPRVETGEPMRDGQRGLVYVLLGKLKTHNHERWTVASEWWESGVQATITKVRCSDVIDRLRGYLAQPAGAPAPVVDTPAAPVQTVPAARTPRDPFDDIPNGRYAVRDAADSQKIHFYRVSRSRDGFYVNLAEYASDTQYPVRPWPRAQAILRTIREQGPEQAAYLFGRTIGSCFRCGRTLTDADSRAAGIGPDCAGKGMF